MSIAWPKRSCESWRYVNTSQISRWFEKGEVDNLAPSRFAASSQKACRTWAQKDYDALDAPVLPEGVSLQGIPQALPFAPNTPLDVLNLEKAKKGWCLHIAANTQLTKPLLWQANADDPIRFQRHALHVASGASLSLIVMGGDGHDASYPMHRSIDVRLEEGAQLSIINVQCAGGVSWHDWHITQGPSSRFAINTIHLAEGDAYRREHYAVHLQQNSQCRFENLTCAQHQAHVDQVVEITHEGIGSFSEQKHAQLLSDAAQGGFHSEARVLSGASKSHSIQKSRSLLLSKEAEAHVKPRLRIDHDDVACQHGATIGYLDEAALLYMRSRGLSEAQARYLLVHGFMQQSLLNVEHSEVLHWLSESMRSVLTTLLATEAVHVG